MKNLTKLMVLAILVCAAISCEKKPDIPEETPITVKPVAVAHGTPNDAAVEKSIGSEGGTIAVPGGEIEIHIPEGTVDVNTNFSIQPVTNTLGTMGIGVSYRLLPENVQFKKDVQIVFNYTEAQTKNTFYTNLSLAYQDSKGYWHRPENVELDPQNLAVRVKTRHFSDWILAHKLMIVNQGKDILEKNQTTDLKVFVQRTINVEDDIDLLLPVVNLENENIVSWELNGLGTLPNTKEMIQKYTAPALIEQRSTANISVTLKDVWGKPKPGQPSESYLFYELKLMPDEYFIWEQNGQEFEGSQRLQAQFISSDQITIMTEAPHQGTSIYLAITGNFPGLHQFNVDQINNSAQASVGYLNFAFYSRYCPPNYKTTAGYVLITSTGNPGDYIIGELAGNVIQNGACNGSSSYVRGKFKIKLK